MKAGFAAAIALAALCLPLQAGDVGVYLDSTNGSSSMIVYDAQTTELMRVQSDGLVVTATNLTVSGKVTASSYDGDGSLISNLNETDPVWSAEKSAYATGTPLYVESDPYWAAADSTTNYVRRNGDYITGSLWLATNLNIFYSVDGIMGLKSMIGIAGGDGIEIGNQAHGYWEGVAIGLNANGSEQGVAVGSSANGMGAGVAIGHQAVGNSVGIGIGAQPGVQAAESQSGRKPTAGIWALHWVISPTVQAMALRSAIRPMATTGVPHSGLMPMHQTAASQ